MSAGAGAGADTLPLLPAINSRLFWPDQLPADQQCAPGANGVSQFRDPGNALPFEAARHCRTSKIPDDT